jgi:hypothetical protein
VFTLTLERIEGRIKYLNSELRDEPEIWKVTGVGAERQRTIEHGSSRPFVIRQWLTKEVVAKMSAGYEADVSKGEFNLMTGQVALWLSYTNVAGVKREFRKGLPGSLG